jgi:hypothetical protein
METDLDHPPTGIRVGRSNEGLDVVQYRPSWKSYSVLFYLAFICMWIGGCVMGTSMALSAAQGANYFFLLCMIPLWIWGGALIINVLWLFRSTLTLIFDPDKLIVTRSLLWYRRSNVFSRSQIAAVQRVEDGGPSHGSFVSWGLVIVAESRFRIMKWQPLGPTNWLGLIIAKWAGIGFVTDKPVEQS